jgi:hypothetical protein
LINPQLKVLLVDIATESDALSLLGESLILATDIEKLRGSGTFIGRHHLYLGFNGE